MTSDDARLEALRRYDILDSEPEPAFDALTRAAALIFHVPMALVSFVDEERQWFKSRVGIDESETEIEASFCAHAIGSDEVMVVPDATRDARFARNRFVSKIPKIRFYAGAPMTTRDGHALGTLCVIDTVPGDFSDEQKKVLKDLADVAMELIELRSAGLAERDQVITAQRDITERKVAEEEVRLAREEAERANQAKSAFLSRMSHELRTPLNAILGFAQILEMDELQPDQRESTEQIIRGGRRLLELINEVLDIARIESGQMALSLEPVSVSDLIDECVGLIKPLAAERGIGVHAECDDPDLHVWADRHRLGQVLLNLLSNAVKYNVAEGNVSVVCPSTQDGNARIGVADTGPGIPPEKVPLLFTPFERLGAERTNVEGTGLGLALSKNLVEAMGGDLLLDTMAGRGSTFWVQVRVADEVRPEFPEDRHDEDVGGSRAPAKVLYIEDNLANLKLIERLLERRTEVEVISAMSGNLGLDLARKHLPDLILLDLGLPDLKGDAVLRRLRRDPVTANIPVVILSADATPGEIRRLQAAGVDDYLTKPIDVRAFLKVFDGLLSRRDADQSSGELSTSLGGLNEETS